MSSNTNPDAPLGRADANLDGRLAIEPPNWLVEYRPLLMVMARKAGYAARLRHKYDCSDIVQQALLRAVRDHGDCKAATEAERVGWLRTILIRTFIDLLRVDKREPVIVCLEQSSARLEGFLEDSGPSPSDHAERRESLVQLAWAIEQLPDRQRDAVILKDLMGHRVAEIAELLSVTRRSVAGLLDRGRQKLCELLPEYPKRSPTGCVPSAGPTAGE